MTVGVLGRSLSAAGRDSRRSTFGPLLFSAAYGLLLSVAAWGPGRTPALALMLPVLWVMSPSRTAAFVATAAYHLGVIRFLPDFAGTWFASVGAGYLMWMATGLVCGLAWALCWPRSSGSSRVVIATLAALVLTLGPPVGAVLPGHPLVGMGYLAGATGWVGVALFFVATAGLCWFFRVWIRSKVGTARWIVPLVVMILGVFLWLDGDRPDASGGQVVGKVGALHTRWGEYPKRDSLEVMSRIEKIGWATEALAGGVDGVDTVIFPESAIGVYDPSLLPAVELEVLRKTRRSGQTVVVGADLPGRDRTMQKAAIVIRPDGSLSQVAARQPVPIAEWRPWSGASSIPIDWLGESTVDIGGGIRARVMFCYEEYIPTLHLLSEALSTQHMVVAVANLWAATDPLASSIQASHTEGMARLFGRPWVRAVNLPARRSPG